MNKTLALNMIVGASESVELRRCLKSIVIEGLFDEIVIVQTADDKYVTETAKEFTDKVLSCAWACERYPHGNFARARNMAIENTTSDYIMWLDADDIVKYTTTQVIYRLKETIYKNDIDYYFMLYTIENNSVLFRERIFRRHKSIRWINPVHEELTLGAMKKYGTVSGISIEHHSTKPAIESINRNLQIINHELQCGNLDPALQAYWAIENLNSNKQQDTAIELLKNIFDIRAFPVSQLSGLAARIAVEIFKRFKVSGFYDDMMQIELYSRIAIDLCQDFAEPYITLAEIYMMQKQTDKALVLFREALTKTVHAGAVQNSEYYKEIPLKRIADIYAEKKESELALYYIKKLLEITVKPSYVDARNRLLVNISEELYVSACKN